MNQRRRSTSAPARPTIAELSAANDALEQRLCELAAALERARAEAHDANARADEAERLTETLLSTLSHELRSPLQGMLSWAQILERVVLDPERARQAARRVVVNVATQARMLDDLLDFSRTRRGKLRLQPERVEVGPIVQRAIDELRSSQPEMQVALELGPGPLWVLADPMRLEQVVFKLAHNAVQASGADSHVRIECAADADDVIVRVHDSGRGIDADDLPGLFEPFPKEGPRNRPHGAGLGLALARHIARLSAGELSAQSDGRGRGATFTLKLPRA